MGLGGGWSVDKSGEIHGPSNSSSSNSGSSQSNKSSSGRSGSSGVTYDSRADTVKVRKSSSGSSTKVKTSDPWDWESAKYTQEEIREAEARQIQEAETKKMLNELKRADESARKALKAKTPPMSHYDVDRLKAAEEVQKFAKTPEQVFEGAREAIEERALEAHAKGLTETNTVERLKIGAELAGLGFAAGALGVTQGMYEIGKTAARGDVLGAGEQLVRGTAEWFVSIPKKVKYAFTDSPYFAGQLAGEIVAGEFVGRSAVKASRSVTAVAEPAGAALFKAQLKTKVYGSILADNIAIRAAPYKMKLQEIEWAITEPLYQKGILKPKTEVVTEKPVSQVLKEAAETYRNIEEGIPGLKGDIRPLSRADIKLIESKIAGEEITPDYLKEAAETYKWIKSGQSNKAPAFTIFKSDVADLMLKEKPKEYFRSAKEIAENLGWEEVIAKEREEWIKNTEIVDISASGETARIETFYKGKRPFKVERELPSEKVPEKVWERFEEKAQEPRNAFKELNRQAEREFKDLNKALREKWKQREREFQRKMQEGKAVKTGGQIQLLEETAKVEEKAKVKTIERTKARAKAEAILERAAKEMEKIENVFKSRFGMKAFLIPEMRFDQVYKQSLGIFPDVRLRFRENVFTGQKVSDLTVEATGIGFPPAFPEPTVEIQDLLQQPVQETVSTTVSIQTPKLKTDLAIESPKKPRRQKSKSAREEKKKSGRKSRGRKYFEVKNPVLRFEDILEKEGRKYVKKLKTGGKRTKRRR